VLSVVKGSSKNKKAVPKDGLLNLEDGTKAYSAAVVPLLAPAGAIPTCRNVPA
jgi:hypothetical protein